MTLITAAAQGMTYGSDLKPGELMNHKIPPSWNGTGSWFAFEELVQDWLEYTTLKPEHHGPALLNIDIEKVISPVAEAAISRKTGSHG